MHLRVQLRDLASAAARMSAMFFFSKSAMRRLVCFQVWTSSSGMRVNLPMAKLCSECSSTSSRWARAAYLVGLATAFKKACTGKHTEKKKTGFVQTSCQQAGGSAAAAAGGSRQEAGRQASKSTCRPTQSCSLLSPTHRSRPDANIELNLSWQSRLWPT